MKRSRMLCVISAALFAASVLGGCGGSTADDVLIDELDDVLVDDIDDDITDTNDIFIFETAEPVPDGEETDGEIFGETEEPNETGEAEEIYGDARNDGEILHIISFNDELKDVFETLYGEENLPDGVRLEYTSFMGSFEYTERLDGILASEENTVDIFVAEPNYIRKYADSCLTLPLSEAGITLEDTADMFPYTVSYGTSSDGVLKGVSYQTEPGVFAYRRDIAEEVFGSDDPDYIHSLITDDWDNTAAALAEKGYYIISSASDTYKLYDQNRTSPWINENGKVTVDGMLKSWAEDMRRCCENGFTPNHSQWSDKWMTDMTSEGRSFGMLLAPWGNEYVLGNFSEDKAGQWGVCLPPKPFYWGGTYLCISSKTDNLDLCGEILKKMISDEDALAQYSAQNRDCCNNRSVMERLAASGEVYSDFLAQNSFEVYLPAAETIRADHITEYDEILEDFYTSAMQDYINGYCPYDEAEEMFFAYVSALGLESE